MPFSFAGAAARFGRGGKWQRDLAVAVLGALFMVLVDGLQGFPLLSDPAGDNDSPMRMVEVADLIVRSALHRKESRGLHYTTDYPEMLPAAVDTILAP